MKRFFTFALFLLIPAFLFSGNIVNLLPGGKVATHQDEVRKIRRSVATFKGFSKVTPYDNSVEGVTGTIDTLGYDANWNTDFGEFGQDVMVMWFKAPADLDIKAVSFNVSDNEQSDVEVKIVKVNFTEDQLLALGDEWFGYYEATGNGFNDISPFEDDAETTGGWVEAGGGTAGSPFGADLWSDLGYGAPVKGVEIGETYWVQMSDLGFEPSVLSGDIFGVAVKNTGSTLDASRFGLSAAVIGYPGFKFYRNGRNTSGGPGVGDCGWWSRTYTWDITVAVDLTGDRSPQFIDADVLVTTLSTAAREVTATITDDNPSGGNAGVASATLYYAVNGDTNYTAIAMSGTEPDYSAMIPGFSPGTSITYYIEAIDVMGNSSKTLPVTYSVFQANSTTLFVYDTSDLSVGTAAFYYYYGIPEDTTWEPKNGGNFSVDIWEPTFGTVSTQLINNYETIYHVMGSGPDNPPPAGDVYKNWLASATAEWPRNLFLSAQDYGIISGFADTTFPAGTFEHDYLGVTKLGPQDINYDGTTASYQSAYRIDAPVGNMLSGYLNDYDTDTTSLAVDPYYELGSNLWIDNMGITDQATAVFTDPAHHDSAVAVYTSGDNWKTTFWTMDPLALLFINDSDSSENLWVLGDIRNPAGPVFTWFGQPIISDIGGEVNNVSRTFALKQNYPNPFNPTTTIEFTIPTNEKVEITVFNVLGKEVANVFNGKAEAGTHQVKFDGSKLASGLYIYRIKAGKNISSRKMLLIK